MPRNCGTANHFWSELHRKIRAQQINFNTQNTHGRARRQLRSAHRSLHHASSQFKLAHLAARRVTALGGGATGAWCTSSTYCSSYAPLLLCCSSSCVARSRTPMYSGRPVVRTVAVRASRARSPLLAPPPPPPPCVVVAPPPAPPPPGCS